MAVYRNPWHKPGRAEYGPAQYETDAAPEHYRGHLIYHRTALVWDVVRDGACVTQMAGPNGARSAVAAGYSFTADGQLVPARIVAP